MALTLDQIWRYPIKGLSAERVASAKLAPGQTLPGDRVYAFAEDGRDVTEGAWAPCRNFLRGAKAPALMAIASETLEDGRLRLTYPDRPPLELDPRSDAATLAAWLAPLWPASRPAPARLISADRAMTDSQHKGHLTVMSRASLDAVSVAAGVEVDARRFRGNLWLTGDIAPWAEADWAGCEISIGPVRLEIIEPVERCRAPNGNPETGAEDVNMLALLREHFGHKDFGMKARVITGGEIRTGTEVVLP